MILLFAGLPAANLICLCLAGALGYIGKSHPDLRQWHQLTGAIAALICCGVHCIVFTYFIATAKWLQHAVMVKHLDTEVITPTRSFKAQALPAALAAIASVVLTVFIGAATLSYEFRGTAHHVLAVIALLINILAAVFEYRAIRRNGSLIDRVLAMINTPAVI